MLLLLYCTALVLRSVLMYRVGVNVKGSACLGAFNCSKPLCGRAPPALSQQQGFPCLAPAPGCAYRRAAAMGILPRARAPSCTRLSARGYHAVGGSELTATTAPRHATSRPAFLFWCASPRAGPAAPAGCRAAFVAAPAPPPSPPPPLSARAKAGEAMGTIYFRDS
jgi:hypothetical protein